MLNHVSIGVANVQKSRKFYDAALKPLGYERLSDGETSLGYGGKSVAFWIGAAERPVKEDTASGLHFCFDAPSRSAVDLFHKAATAHGGRDNASPAFAPTTAKIITRRSSSTPTAIASKRIAERNHDDDHQRD